MIIIYIMLWGTDAMSNFFPPRISLLLHRTATQTNSTSPNRLTPTSDKQNFSLQDQYNNKQKIDEKKEKNAN